MAAPVAARYLWRPVWPAMLVAALGILPACSINHFVTRKLADAFAGTGGGYASDDDPDLIRAAAPFGLKTMEQILVEQPRHVGLLTSLASGYTAYAVAFVQQEADELADKDVARAHVLELRARKLYLRAREYGFRGLDATHPGAADLLRNATPDKASARDKLLASMTPADVPLLYWTAASWGLAIAAGKDQMKLIGDLPAVESIMARAFALDESWDAGAIHEFYVAYDASRSAAEGGGPEKAKEHLDRALSLSKNTKLGGIVSYAEGIVVAQQDKASFARLLLQVTSFDVDTAPAHRLANLVAQRRARWLLARSAELFAE